MLQHRVVGRVDDLVVTLPASGAPYDHLAALVGDQQVDVVVVGARIGLDAERDEITVVDGPAEPDLHLSGAEPLLAVPVDQCLGEIAVQREAGNDPAAEAVLLRLVGVDPIR